jgi:hypothetical protein
MKTSELTGAALDWAVDKCQGRNWESAESFLAYHDEGQFNYSTDWAQGGPIIERECICVECLFDENAWSAWTPAPERESGEAYGIGPTPLIAAMRCYVASKLGDEVEIPEELC